MDLTPRKRHSRGAVAPNSPGSETDEMLASMVESSSAVGLPGDVIARFFQRPDAPPIDNFLHLNDPGQESAETYEWELGDHFEAKMEARKQQLLQMGDVGNSAALVQEWVTLVSMLEASQTIGDGDIDDSQFSEDALYQKYLDEELAAAQNAADPAPPVKEVAGPVADASGSDDRVQARTQHHGHGRREVGAAHASHATPPPAAHAAPAVGEASAFRPLAGIGSRQPDTPHGTPLLQFSMADWVNAGAPIRRVRIHADANGRLGLGLQSTAMRGVRVTDISPNSAAATCVPPIQINDMILQINSINVLGVALPKVKEILKATPDGQHQMCVVARAELEVALRRLMPPRSRGEHGVARASVAPAPALPAADPDEGDVSMPWSNTDYAQRPSARPLTSASAAPSSVSSFMAQTLELYDDDDMLDNSDLAGDMALPYQPGPGPEPEPEQPTSWLDAVGTGDDDGMYSDDAMGSYNYEEEPDWKAGLDLGGYDAVDGGLGTEISDGGAGWKGSPSRTRRAVEGEGYEAGFSQAQSDPFDTSFRQFDTATDDRSNKATRANLGSPDRKPPGANIDAWKVAYKSADKPQGIYVEPVVSAAEAASRQIRDLERLNRDEDFHSGKNASGLLCQGVAYVEPAGSVVEANDPNRALREIERIDYRKDFKTLGKGGSTPIAPVVHEPYVDPAKRLQMTSVRSSGTKKSPKPERRAGDRSPTTGKRPTSSIPSHIIKPRPKAGGGGQSSKALASAEARAAASLQRLEQLAKQSAQVRARYDSTYATFVAIAGQLDALAREGVPVPVGSGLMTPAPALDTEASFLDADVAPHERCRRHTDQLEAHRKHLGVLAKALGAATLLRNQNLLRSLGVEPAAFTLERLPAGHPRGGFGIQVRTGAELPLFCTLISQVAADVVLSAGAAAPRRGQALLQIDGCSVLLWSHAEVVEYLGNPKRQRAAFTVADAIDLQPALRALSAATPSQPATLKPALAPAEPAPGPAAQYDWMTGDDDDKFERMMARTDELLATDLSTRPRLLAEWLELQGHSAEIGLM